MIDEGPTITQGAQYFSARAAELQFKRLALQGRLVDEMVEFGGMRLKFCDDGKLVVVVSSPLNVTVELGGNRVVISPPT
jgi:hypothetical protein